MYKPGKDATLDISYDSSGDSDSKQEICASESCIFLWLEDGVGYYLGCLGQQSYSFASPNDIIVAYNYLNMDKDWFLWLLDLNKLSPSQFFWIQKIEEPQSMHIVKEEFVLKQIGMMITSKFKQNGNLRRIKLKPYCQSKEMEESIYKIKSYTDNYLSANIITCIASNEWKGKFADKSCLHRYADNIDNPSLFEQYAVFTINGLSECAGFICKNKDEILKSYDLLIKKIGHNNVVLKDCFGCSGDDISFYNSKQDIIDKFIWKPQFKLIEIEENLKYNTKQEIEKVEFVGISFYDNKVIGCGHEQIIIDDAIFGGSKTYKNKIITQKLQNIATNVMSKIGAKYMGGFDFAVQSFKNKQFAPKIYLIDMNTARYTGTTQTFVVMKKFQICNKFFIRRNLQISKKAVFDTLLNSHSDLLFNIKTGIGAYFHLFHPNDQVAVVSIFGDNEQDSNNILKTICSINMFI